MVVVPEASFLENPTCNNDAMEKYPISNSNRKHKIAKNFIETSIERIKRRQRVLVQDNGQPKARVAFSCAISILIMKISNNLEEKGPSLLQINRRVHDGPETVRNIPNGKNCHPRRVRSFGQNREMQAGVRSSLGDSDAILNPHLKRS